MIICPKTVHEEYVGTVTKPVTHTEVVAVNNASKYEILKVELIGKNNNKLPQRIVIKKLNNIICVVDILICFFTIKSPLYLYYKEKKPTYPYDKLTVSTK